MAKRHLRLYWTAYATLVIGLGIALLGYRLTQRQVRSEHHARFVQVQSTTQSTLFLLFNEYINILSGIKALIENRDETTPEDFQRYLVSINIKEFKAHLLDVGYAPRVLRQDWGAHLEHSKKLGFTHYRPQIEPNDPEAFPIFFFHDFKTPDIHGGGWNTLSSPQRKAAMEMSIQSGIPASTGKMRLITYDGKNEPEGIVIYLPVFRDGIHPNNAQDRRKQLIGFVFGSIITSSLGNGIIETSQSPDVDMEIYDGDGLTQDKLIFDSDKIPRNLQSPSAAPDASFKAVAKLNELGRTWTLRYTGLAALESDGKSRFPLVVLAAGLVTTLALWTLVWIQVRARRKAETDALELAQAASALASEKERLSVTLRSIGDGVLTVDAGGAIVLLNQAAEQLTGWKSGEAQGRRFGEVCQFLDRSTAEPIFHPVELPPAGAVILESAREAFMFGKHGEKRLVENSCAPILDQSGALQGAVFVFRDITQRDKLAEEQLKVGKLESLGTLAGGIAHDFNNILTTILGNVSLTRQTSEDKGELQPFLIEAEKACTQARSLTQQLLTFSKGGAPIRQSVSLTEVIHDSARFATTGSQSCCKFDISLELWPVEADKGQISQVIQNIVLNASQAMSEGGSIEVSAENAASDSQCIPALKPGRYVKIAVQDQGEGISPEFLPRVFDPYFSTKKRGTGLGLATCYSIVKRHEGHIQFSSSVGKGSKVTFWLPASDKLPEAPMPVVTLVKSGVARKLLLMDDDPQILKTLSAMLQRLGMQVVPTKDGLEAIAEYERARDRKEPFDAVILDLTIPGGMGGRATLMRLRQINRSVLAIVSSGYSNDPILASYQSHGFSAMLAKPYQMETLSQTLNEILGAV